MTRVYTVKDIVRGKKVLKNGAVAGFVKINGQEKWRIVKKQISFCLSFQFLEEHILIKLKINLPFRIDIPSHSRIYSMCLMSSYWSGKVFWHQALNCIVHEKKHFWGKIFYQIYIDLRLFQNKKM